MQHGVPFNLSIFKQQLHRLLFSPALHLQDVLCASYLNHVGVLFDGMLLTAGRCLAAPSGSPQAGTSAGRPKTSKGASSLG